MSGGDLMTALERSLSTIRERQAAGLKCYCDQPSRSGTVKKPHVHLPEYQLHPCPTDPVLPNGCEIRPGARIRIPAEHLDDALAMGHGIHAEAGSGSIGSVVVVRPAADLEALNTNPEEG